MYMTINLPNFNANATFININRPTFIQSGFNPITIDIALTNEVFGIIAVFKMVEIDVDHVTQYISLNISINT